MQSLSKHRFPHVLQIYAYMYWDALHKNVISNNNHSIIPNYYISNLCHISCNYFQTAIQCARHANKWPKRTRFVNTCNSGWIFKGLLVAMWWLISHIFLFPLPYWKRWYTFSSHCATLRMFISEFCICLFITL